jgi:hypothetical protein
MLDNNNGGGLPIHLELKVIVLVGEEEHVIDGQGYFYGELAPSFKE